MNSTAGVFRSSPRNQSPSGADGCILLLHDRALDRECLAMALVGRGTRLPVAAFSDISRWEEERRLHPPVKVVLFHIGTRSARDPSVADDMARIGRECPVPVVVISQIEDCHQVVGLLEHGCGVFVPTSSGIAVLAAAVNLAMVGGGFVTGTSFLSAIRLQEEGCIDDEQALGEMFSPRQRAVAQALRKGKTNKVIAYELSLCESTVKVHVRHIMRKLKATSRTQVACKLNEDLGPSPGVCG